MTQEMFDSLLNALMGCCVGIWFICIAMWILLVIILLYYDYKNSQLKEKKLCDKIRKEIEDAKTKD